MRLYNRLFLVMILVLQTAIVFGQGGGGGTPPGGGGDPGGGQPVPIEGLGLLLVGGAMLGLKKIGMIKKRKQIDH